MKRGELAKFTLKAEYAYGKTGSPPKIPPDATLIFEIELFDWKGIYLSITLISDLFSELLFRDRILVALRFKF